MSRYKGATLIAGSGDASSIRGVNVGDIPETFTESLTLQLTTAGQLVWSTVSVGNVTNNVFATFEETTTDVEYINSNTNRSYVMSIELDTPATVTANAERYQLKLHSIDYDTGTPGNRESTTLTGAALQAISDQGAAAGLEDLTTAENRAAAYFLVRETLIP